MEMYDRRNESDVFGSRKKLTWISREESDRSCSPNSLLSDDCPPIQKDSVRGRPGTCRTPGTSARLRGSYNRTSESPSQRGESVRQIRTFSKDRGVDVDIAKGLSSNLFASRSRSVKPPPGSIHGQESLAVIGSNYSLVKPGRAASPYHPTASPYQPTAEESAREHRIQSATQLSLSKGSEESSESLRMVVSYLAEETERIIKARNSRNSRSNSTAEAAAQPQTTDREKKSDAVSQNVKGSPFPTDGSTATTTPSNPGDGTGPARALSATMAKYLESRKMGTHLGSQIRLDTSRPGLGTTPSLPDSPSSMLLSLASELENSSTSSKIGIGRYDHFSTPRVALSPLNGNEGVTYSVPSSHGKEENSGGLGEAAEARRQDRVGRSVQIERQIGFSSRYSSGRKLAGINEMDSDEDVRNMSQRVRERPTPLREEVKGSAVSQLVQSKGIFPQGRWQTDGHVRHPEARGRSQRVGEPGKSLLSENVRGSGNGAPRLSQSCRHESIRNPLFIGEEDQTVPDIKQIVFNNPSNAKSSKKLPINLPPSAANSLSSTSSRETLNREHLPILAHVEKWKRLHKVDSFDHTKVIFPVPEKSFLGSRRIHSVDKFSPQLDRTKMSHPGSQSFNQDTFNRSRMDSFRIGLSQTSSRSSSVSQGCSNSSDSSKSKPRTSSPAVQFQKWLLNPFKLGSKGKSSSGSKSKDAQLQEEQSPRKKSPWTARPGEILQVITGRKKNTESAKLDLQGLHNLRLRSSRFEYGNQSPMMEFGFDPSHGQMMSLHLEAAGGNYTPVHSMRYRDADANSTPAHLMMHMPVDAGGSSTPFHHRSYSFYKEAGGKSTPAHETIQVDVGGYSTPAQRLSQMQTEAERYSSPVHAKTYMDAGPNSTPSRRKAYVLPPIPSSSPADARGLHSFYTNSGRLVSG